uniref:Uncharacterized protein n=1 Tax=Naja naja TaxID=35670 RepID=A0A8C6XZD3_NAJNA
MGPWFHCPTLFGHQPPSQALLCRASRRPLPGAAQVFCCPQSDQPLPVRCRGASCLQFGGHLQGAPPPRAASSEISGPASWGKAGVGGLGPSRDSAVAPRKGPPHLWILVGCASSQKAVGPARAPWPGVGCG